MTKNECEICREQTSSYQRGKIGEGHTGVGEERVGYYGIIWNHTCGTFGNCKAL